MSEGLNRVILLGNLGADPELRFTQVGSAVLNMRIATTESFVDRDKKRQERTEWHNVVLFGARAEALSRFLRKGATVLIEGSLRTTNYDDRDGNKRQKTEVIAANVCLAGGVGRRDTHGEPPREQQRTAPRGQRPIAAHTMGAEAAQVGDFELAGGDDDIPF